METAKNKIAWVIDPVHSIISFECKYLLLTAVKGRFSEIEGKVTTSNSNFDNSSIQVIIYTNSLTTFNDVRDEHLRSSDFFETKEFPKISFNSTVVKLTDSTAHVVGELTIKDKTKKILFDAKFMGLRKDPFGNEKAGFEMRTTINRNDFNISWNSYFDQQGVLLSDEIDILCDVQLLKLN